MLPVKSNALLHLSLDIIIRRVNVCDSLYLIEVVSSDRRDNYRSVYELSGDVVDDNRIIMSAENSFSLDRKNNGFLSW